MFPDHFLSCIENDHTTAAAREHLMVRSKRETGEYGEQCERSQLAASSSP
jgi:hypothetical protein